MDISVVIPAYNEEANIKVALLKILLVYPDAEIIVVNDASTDKTWDILLSLAKEGKFSHLKMFSNARNMGHGYSVVRGLLEASREWVLYVDADNQLRIMNHVPNAYFMSGQRIGRQDKLFRKIISFCLKTTIRLRYGYSIKDANCPYKMYKRSVLIPLLKELPKTYIVPIACLEVLARKHDIECETIPIIHYPYLGERKGFLQSVNLKMLMFLVDAFAEIVSL